jgi:hypothetical protein
LDVRFGDDIALTGVTLPATAQAGQPLALTLHWQAITQPARDYTAFAHLVDAQGVKVAQLDWRPYDSAGLLPTSVWQPGQPVVDSQTFDLPGDLAPGVYRLVAGLYFWETGERLPVQGAQAVPNEDVVDLGTIMITDQ